jgi:hypothetical protein
MRNQWSDLFPATSGHPSDSPASRRKSTLHPLRGCSFLGVLRNHLISERLNRPIPPNRFNDLRLLEREGFRNTGKSQFPRLYRTYPKL